MSKRQRIYAAACMSPRGHLYFIAPPARHHDVLHSMPEADRLGCKQGFVTDRGNFVQRPQALRIARAAGQILRETAPKHGLFSEDVW